MTDDGAWVCRAGAGDPRQRLVCPRVDVVPVMVLQMMIPNQPPEIGIVQPKAKQGLPTLRTPAYLQHPPAGVLLESIHGISVPRRPPPPLATDREPVDNACHTATDLEHPSTTVGAISRSIRAQGRSGDRGAVHVGHGSTAFGRRSWLVGAQGDLRTARRESGVRRVGGWCVIGVWRL